jgi:hypothetical protein
VESAVHEQSLHLSYENRHYRSQAAALAEVMRLLAPSASTYDSLHIRINHLSTPMMVIHTAGSDLSALLQGDLAYNDWRGRIRYEMTVLTSGSDPPRRAKADGFTGVDLLLGTGIRYQLGNYGGPDDNYRVAFDLLPEARVDLPLGLQARGRLALPLWNNLDANTGPRPDLITLNRGFRGQDGFFGWLSAGVYPQNRACAQVQMRQFLPDERLFPRPVTSDPPRFLATDDDSGGNSDAQLSFTFPSSGTFVLVANTFAAGASGAYRLDVQWARGGDDAGASQQSQSQQQQQQ